MIFRVCKVIFLSGICLFLVFYAFFAGYRFNDSYSVPIGIWKIDSVSGRGQKGDYAVIPPEIQPAHQFAIERGYLIEGRCLLKKVAGVAGDLIDYNATMASVTVNGEWLPHTTIFSEDSAGRPLPTVKFPVYLKQGEVWLSSENIRGFDSRYFGPVSADFIIKAIPVFLFE